MSEAKVSVKQRLQFCAIHGIFEAADRGLAVSYSEAAAHIERIEALNAAQAQAIGAALAELETEGKELWPRAGAAWEILSKAATPTTEGATS